MKLCAFSLCINRRVDFLSLCFSQFLQFNLSLSLKKKLKNMILVMLIKTASSPVNDRLEKIFSRINSNQHQLICQLTSSIHKTLLIEKYNCSTLRK
jgi:hypothetical protein